MAPLRERGEDVPLQANHFLRRLASEMGMADPRLSAESLAALEQYDFPGNVRELKNLIERSLIESGGGEIRSEHLHFCFPPTRCLATSGSGEKAGHTAQAAKVLFPPEGDEGRILAYVQQAGSITNSQCRDLLSVGLHRACYPPAQTPSRGPARSRSFATVRTYRQAGA